MIFSHIQVTAARLTGLGFLDFNALTIESYVSYHIVYKY
jgi:hypothetical protein